MSAKTNAAEDRLTFFVEWFDAQADLIRRYQFTYFDRDSTLEMYDCKNRRPFLKRTEYPSIRQQDLYVGSIVTVYSRQLRIVEYGDVRTRRVCEAERSHTLGLVKPGSYDHIGLILQRILASGLTVGNMQLVKLSQAQASEFYAEHKGKPFFDKLVSMMSSDVVLAMELVGDMAISNWRDLMGPTNPEQARSEAPNSIRAQFGQDVTNNAVHGSDSAESAARELSFFFGPGVVFPTTGVLNNCTCCIIRPHAATQMGDIIDVILKDKFEISAIKMLHLKKHVAEEFLEVYKGVLPEYHDVVQEMSSGPVIVMEVRQENAVESFRECCGPHDPDIARHLRPQTLRARFGIDRVKNAVHCTDLPEDGLLECEYFFSIMHGKTEL